MPLLAALFDLNGTATRKQAFRVFLVLVLGLAATLALAEFAPGYLRFAAPAFGMLIVWWWATLVRRLHDAGRSGVWALLLIVPVAGVLTSLAGLFLGQDRPYNDSHAGLRAAGSFGLVLVALFWLTRLFWSPFWSPSESMKPTLLTGDYYVTRYAQAESLVRGDVVVFRHPVNGSPMVKRLIGLPGDVVQVQEGLLVLNGQPVSQEDAGVSREIYGPQGPAGLMPRCSNAVVGIGGICELHLRRETLPEGRGYLVANVEDGAHADNMGPFTVPEGQLFFLGDHRDNSSDSRFAQGAGGLGFVPAENVVGRVTRVIFSASGSSLWAFWDWRGDRFFRAVE